MALLIANIGNVHRGVFSHGVFPIDRPAPSCRHKEKPQGKLPAFPHCGRDEGQFKGSEETGKLLFNFWEVSIKFNLTSYL